MNLEDAVTLTTQIVDFSNSLQGEQFLSYLGDKFGLELNPNYHVHVNSITDICPDCSNCHAGSCEVGCLIEPDFRICYTVMGLSLLGDRLVVHEMAHLWFSQVYDTGMMTKNDYMNTSEKFALFVEKNYTKDIVSQVKDVTVSMKTISITTPVVAGISVLAVASILGFSIWHHHNQK
jgi:uncharacterized protein YqgQ